MAVPSLDHERSNVRYTSVVQVVVFALGIGSTESHIRALLLAVEEISKEHYTSKADFLLPLDISDLDERLEDDLIPQMTPREAFTAAKRM